MENIEQNDMNNTLISRTSMFQNYFLQLWIEQHRLQDKQIHEFTVVEAADWVQVIPENQYQQFLLIKQYRPAWRQMSLEFPGGRMNPIESPEHCALRELEEETGYKARKLVKISKVKPVSYTTQTCHIFYATDLVVGQKNTDPSEFTESVFLTRQEVEQKIIQREIIEMPSIASWGFFRLQEEGVRESSLKNS
ncbi:MAG: NUDIX hydrolase [Candidatus Hodarchaeota archaeon]